MAFAQNQLGEVRTNSDVMGTLNTNANASGRNTPMMQSGQTVRRLMPTECLRLQGLPDDWLDLEPALSDSAKYRMIGNSVAVPVLEWIGRRIIEAWETRERGNRGG